MNESQVLMREGAMENQHEEDDPYACKQRETIITMPDGWNILPAFWVRHSVQDDLRLDRFLLDYHLYFLPSVGGVLWALCVFL
jgi:hypothetical protein